MYEDTCDILILIPTFNEGKFIEKTIKAIKKFFPNILIVDDGSEDDTMDKISSLNITLIKHLINLGQGAALETGFKYFLDKTNYKYVITFDADGQHSEHDAYKMVKYAKEGHFSAVIGNRFKDKASAKKIPLFKKFILRIANIYEKLFYEVKFNDSHNGLRVLSRDCVKYLMPLVHKDMNHATEISSKICKNNICFSEYPVKINYEDVKSQSPLNSINLILKKIFP